MSHPIPKELKGEERIFSIPYLDLHFNKKAAFYCFIATAIAGLFSSINSILALVLFLIFNSVAYSIGTFRISKKKFECGNVPYDVYIWRKLMYMKNKKIYVRRRGA